MTRLRSVRGGTLMLPDGSPMTSLPKTTVLIALTAAGLTGPATGDSDRTAAHHEAPDDPYIEVPITARVTAPAAIWERNGFVSVQVNVAFNGDNIVGDAANEPSIAADPNDPNRMVVGWRQFDSIASNFRQAGWGYTTDGGQSWVFPGVIEPGVFRSDPVLDFNAGGVFVYNSLGTPGGGFCTDNFRSSDGGQTWDDGVFSFGGDKQWMSIDRSGGTGDGHIYAFWTSFFGCTAGGEFNRSTDGGASYESPSDVPGEPQWGTTAVGPAGEVYVAGVASTPSGVGVAKSTTLSDPGAPVAFDSLTDVDLDGSITASTGPNPGGLLGQVWVAVDPRPTEESAPVYVLASVNPPGADPLDVHFVRSLDGGTTWSTPRRVNDDPGTDAWQWFGTMAVAPDGRIDVVWNDTRNAVSGFQSELFYSYSEDGGATWSANRPISPPFDPHIGWPNQSKIGDYYDMVSNAAGTHVAYSATFNGEQDVYYVRLDGPYVFRDGFESGDTSRWQGVDP